MYFHGIAVNSELLRDAFGEEKFCFILVAELKDPPPKNTSSVQNGR